MQELRAWKSSLHHFTELERISHLSCLAGMIRVFRSSSLRFQLVLLAHAGCAASQSDGPLLLVLPQAFLEP